MGEEGKAAPSDAEIPKKEYAGLRGWLILVCLGLIVSPARILLSFYTDFFPIVSNDTWGLLTTPGSDAYHPLWAPLLIGELAVNTGIIIFSIILLRLFFAKRKEFPRLYIIYSVLSLGFVLIDAWAAGFIPAVAAQNDPSTIKEIARSLVGCVLWIPYMLKSRRVKNTFVL